MPRKQIDNPRVRNKQGALYSDAVEAPPGRTLYISGLTSKVEGGAVAGENNIRLQTETIFEHMTAVLSEAGGSLDDVVKLTTYLVDIAQAGQIRDIRQRYFTEPYPASTLLGVSALADPRMLIEIEAVAVIPNGAGQKK